MLTRIRNAVANRHGSVTMPTSKARVSLSTILKHEGYIRDFEVVAGKPQGVLKIHLLYREGKESAIRGVKRVSKPGLRVYVEKGEIPRVYGGLGTAIISTSQGVMTGRDAWRKGIGGELICHVW
jgi:small subunit ribosomal protein S8